jgi:hypothetical protein
MSVDRLSLPLILSAGAGIVAVIVAAAVLGAERLWGGATEEPDIPVVREHGMLIYDGLEARVEYPEDWTQMGPDDFGSFDHYGMMLISPNGTEVFINFNTRDIEVRYEHPADREAVERLRTEGITFHDLPTEEPASR